MEKLIYIPSHGRIDQCFVTLCDQVSELSLKDCSGNTRDRVVGLNFKLIAALKFWMIFQKIKTFAINAFIHDEQYLPLLIDSWYNSYWRL